MQKTKDSLLFRSLFRIFSEENLTYILKSGGISFVFKMAGILLGFFVIVIVSKLYNEKFYGTFALLQILIQSLVIIFTLGLQNILVIEVNKKVGQNAFALQLLKKIYSKVAIIGLIPSLILFFSASYISDWVFHKPQLDIGFKIMGVSLIVFLLYEVTLNYFIAKKSFIKFGLYMFVIPNLLFIAYLFFFKEFVTNNENYIFLVYALAFLTSLVLAILSIKWYNTKDVETLPSFSRLLKDSTPIMMSAFTLFMLNWIGVIILGRYFDESLVGIYNTAFKLGSSVQLVMLTINIIIAPKIANLYHSNQKEKLKIFIHQTTWFIGALSLPLVLIIIIFKKQLLGLFSESFVTHGSQALVIITIATFINAITGNVDQILNMTNNQKSFFKVIIWALVVNVLCNLILIPNYGINGAAIACLIATVFMNFYALIVIKRKLGFYTMI